MRPTPAPAASRASCSVPSTSVGTSRSYGSKVARPPAQPGTGARSRSEVTLARLGHVFVLVTGATGYIGGRLVPELLAAGHEVRCVVRSPAKLDEVPWRGSVEVVRGDAEDGPSL